MLMREITERQFQSRIIMRVMMSTEIKAYKEMSYFFSKESGVAFASDPRDSCCMTMNMILLMMRRKSLEASD
jgi:hypothetical protein